MLSRVLHILFFCLIHYIVSSQELFYSPAESGVENLLKYEAIGRVGKNILIYREQKDQHVVSVFDNNMSLVRKVELSNLPKDVLGVDFINTGGNLVLVYQYIFKNKLFVAATNLNEEVKMIIEPKILDSTQIGDIVEFPLFQLITNPGKNLLMLTYLRQSGEGLTRMSTAMYQQNLQLIEKSDLLVSTPDGSDKLNQFQLDNEGNLVFLRNVLGEESGILVRSDILVKPRGIDEVKNATIQFNKIGIKDLRIAIDNKNSRVVAASIFTGGKKGYAQGIFSLIVDLRTGNVTGWHQEFFSDSLRREIKVKHTPDSRIFDDYFLDAIIPYSNGGFALLLEYRTTEGSRGAIVDNRSLYKSDPLPPRIVYNGNAPEGSLFSVIRTPYQPFQLPVESSPRSYIRNTGGNMLMLSFSGESILQDIQILRKSQEEYKTSHLISYTLLNSGSGIRFLYNEKEKPEMSLRSAIFIPGERVKRNPALKGTIPNMRFLPRYATQIGANECIIPCIKANYGSFARIVF
ncbi:MAG: hypothetical protein RL000_964 [Bacteroidota bacterium]|jgi:hypothetical protein